MSASIYTSPPAPIAPGCHTFEIVVALSFSDVDNHTPDSLGGDSVTWFYAPGDRSTAARVRRDARRIDRGAHPTPVIERRPRDACEARVARFRRRARRAARRACVRAGRRPRPVDVAGQRVPAPTTARSTSSRIRSRARRAATASASRTRHDRFPLFVIALPESSPFAPGITMAIPWSAAPRRQCTRAPAVPRARRRACIESPLLRDPRAYFLGRAVCGRSARHTPALERRRRGAALPVSVEYFPLWPFPTPPRRSTAIAASTRRRRRFAARADARGDRGGEQPVSSPRPATTRSRSVGARRCRPVATSATSFRTTTRSRRCRRRRSPPRRSPTACRSRASATRRARLAPPRRDALDAASPGSRRTSATPDDEAPLLVARPLRRRNDRHRVPPHRVAALGVHRTAPSVTDLEIAIIRPPARRCRLRRRGAQTPSANGFAAAVPGSADAGASERRRRVAERPRRFEADPDPRERRAARLRRWRSPIAERSAARIPLRDDRAAGPDGRYAVTLPPGTYDVHVVPSSTAARP